MVDDLGQTAVAEPSTEPTEPVTAPVTTDVPATTPDIVESIIDKDGNLRTGWQDTLPEEIRSEPSLATIGNLNDMAKSLVHAQKKFGKTAVAVPNEKSTPEEWNDFFNTLGRPSTAEGYVFDVPEELKGTFDENVMKEAKDLFYKAGFNTTQAKALWEFEKKRVVDGLAMLEKEEADKALEAERIIKEKSGSDYDKRLNLANRMISENYEDGETKEKLLEAINESSVKPYMMDFLANIATKFLEHKQVIPQDTEALYEVETQIKELMNTDAYTNRNNPDHKSAVERVRILFEKKAARKAG
jgi:hypothetical protein